MGSRILFYRDETISDAKLAIEANIQESTNIFDDVISTNNPKIVSVILRKQDNVLDCKEMTYEEFVNMDEDDETYQLPTMKMINHILARAIVIHRRAIVKVLSCGYPNCDTDKNPICPDEHQWNK